ncbi:hypothetical protein [Nocardia sp. alder85J]|uniref:hypothetical protein n=1 Tax=Nocardia sp. alder85J TaxID=2862949 RepID=UPI0022513F06|nr:hypothetical protein [Nocardia sp. alder85J]MCX4092720.1 hypothetical protein [Nocardia sp. alder85J]
MAVPMTANIALALAGVLGPATLIALTALSPTRHPHLPAPTPALHTPAHPESATNPPA